MNFIAERKVKKTVEDPAVKKERLNAWWHKQFASIEAHRARRHLYRSRGTKCMAEVDVDLHHASDMRDYHADVIAETARNKKRKTMAANRRKK